MADHASRSHKTFAASDPRWWLCPGALRFCRGMPEVTNPAAEEGTRAHEWLQYKLVGGARPKHELEDGMIEAIEMFKEEVAKIPGPYSLIVEKSATLNEPLAPGEVGGTTDFAAYSPDLRKMWVKDFKYGAGIAVDIEGNTQIPIYAASIIDTYGWAPLEIELEIVQPRAFHPRGPVRSKTITISELEDFRVDVHEAVERCLAPDAPLIPGEHQCRFCVGRVPCPALAERAVAIAGRDFRKLKIVEMPAANELKPDEIARIMESRGLITKWLDAVAAEAYKLALAGTPVPGHKLVQPVGRRAFNGTVAEASAKLEEITGLPAAEFVRDSMLTLEDTEKLIKSTLKPRGKEAVKKGMEQFAFLTTKKVGDKLQLVSDDDPRPAVNPAAQAFANLVQIPHIQQTGE